MRWAWERTARELEDGRVFVVAYPDDTAPTVKDGPLVIQLSELGLCFVFKRWSYELAVDVGLRPRAGVTVQAKEP